MNTPAQVIVRAVETGVRPVRLRIPFRFGAHTLTACPQLFVRVDAEVEGHGIARGVSADLMVPKWFDKREVHTPAENVEHLALAVEQASQAYLDAEAATPFDMFWRHYQALLDSGHAAGLTDLSVAFGQSMLDRALIDATCLALGTSFFVAARHNLLGFVDTPLVKDLQGWAWDNWLSQLRPRHSIEARHTIGLLDDIDDVIYAEDGAPISLRAAIERYGNRYFKVKLSGAPEADLQRLRAVLDVLNDELGPGVALYTLDGNEQYADAAALRALLDGLRDLPPPLYVEQPLPRDQSFSGTLPTRQAPAPLLMDEADGALDAFARARKAGWTGVSSKSCKGIYKALINRARCDRWNHEQKARHYFMSAEDLTCQAGVSLQQDLALVSLLGLEHSERNGHYYGWGLAAAPATERHDFAQEHPDLYGSTAAGAPLLITGGAMHLDSLFRPGFAHRADPDFNTLQPLSAASALL